MSTREAERWSRREFVSGLTLAGAAGLLGFDPAPAAAEPPSETTTLKLVWSAGICQAPQYVADELLRSEGFTDVQYVKKGAAGLASGDANIMLTFAAPLISRVDAGDPIVILAGGHIGCFELFATDQVRSVRDLKGKIVAVPGLETPQHLFLASMLAYVGVAPGRDVTWVTYPFSQSMELLAEGLIDAFLGFPPEPQELRAKKIGHVLVNSAMDRPWSRYFCCMFAGNGEFVRTHPVASKRALRAMLKAVDLCALEPDRVARSLVDKGYTQSYEYAQQALREIPYRRWREYDAEDTVRFYALRLHEAGMIKSSPKKIIAQGTNWRFLTELKKELKG